MWLSVPPLTRRKPSLHQRLGQGAALATICAGVLAEARLGGLEEGHRLAGDDMLERAALPPGEHRLVDGGGVLGLGRGSHPPRGPRRVLWVVKVTMSA